MDLLAISAGFEVKTAQRRDICGKTSPDLKLLVQFSRKRIRRVILKYIKFDQPECFLTSGTFLISHLSVFLRKEQIRWKFCQITFHRTTLLIDTIMEAVHGVMWD